MLKYPLGLLLVGLMAVTCYLTGPPAPAESSWLKTVSKARAATRAHVPAEENGYTILAFIPRPGNPPERAAIYNLSQYHGNPQSAGLPQALAVFRSFRPLFDQAVSRPRFLYPARQASGVEGLTVASWLGRAFLVDGADREEPTEQMEAALKTWRLGRLTIENENIPTLQIGSEMVWLASEGLRPLIANGKLSPEAMRQLQDFLEQNRLYPGSLVRAGDAELVFFERSARKQSLDGAGTALPRFLQGAYREREVRVFEVCYLRIRPGLLHLTPNPKFNLPETLAIMTRNGDRMAVRSFPPLDQLLLSYRFVLDRQDQIRAAVALQLAWTPEHGYPALSSLGLEQLSPRLRLYNDRLMLSASDYPGLSEDELGFRLKPAAGRKRPLPAAPRAGTASPES